MTDVPNPIIHEKNVINEYLSKLPDILKYREDETDVNTNIDEFNKFQELPLEVQEKILYLEPKRSLTLSKSYQKNLLLQANYYDKYCLTSSISKKELKNYLELLIPGELTNFSYILIGRNGIYDPFLRIEKFDIVKLTNGSYLVIRGDDDNYSLEKESNSNSLVENILYTTEIYMFLPSVDVLDQILKQRQNCNNGRYFTHYVSYFLNSFYTYFGPFPLVLEEFAVNYLGMSDSGIDKTIIKDLKDIQEGAFVEFKDVTLYNNAYQKVIEFLSYQN
jgi:hypothetical protein